jgi:peroxiredoxin
LGCLFAADSVTAQNPRQRRKGRPRRPVDKLKVGDAAPDFTLKTLDGKSEVTLSSFQGKKPVMLVFGSYT